MAGSLSGRRATFVRPTATQSCVRPGTSETVGRKRRPRVAIASRPRYDSRMSRALAILKYVPAVLCGLLVVAWVVTFVGSFGIVCRTASQPDGSGRGEIFCMHGSFCLFLGR